MVQSVAGWIQTLTGRAQSAAAYRIKGTQFPGCTWCLIGRVQGVADKAQSPVQEGHKLWLINSHEKVHGLCRMRAKSYKKSTVSQLRYTISAGYMQILTGRVQCCRMRVDRKSEEFCRIR